METTGQRPSAPLNRAFQWWRKMDAESSRPSDELDVPVAPMLDVKWCSVHHVSLGGTPHSVGFKRDAHTLMIFDPGSYADGERWIDGDRMAFPGPLDVGIDVVPAHTEFRAWAASGSTVGCTLISIADDNIPDLIGHVENVDHGMRPTIGLQSGLLQSLAARLRETRVSGDVGPGDTLYLEALCTVICREVLVAQSQSQAAKLLRPKGGLSPRSQRLVKDYLQCHMDQKVELQTLSAVVGISQFHFARAFKVSFGLPPHKYLLNMRLQRAVELLRDPGRSITDVALNVGFSCSSEFARAFRQALGRTPRDFRNARH
jgi:AraC family transcriptional regulator